jgi:hypothetical protein
MRSIHAGVAVCAVVMLAGCGSAVEGDAGPATDLGTATATPSAPPPATTTTAAPSTPALVPAASGADLLLKRSELGEIIGDTDLVETQAYTGPQRSNVKIDPWECRSRALAGESGVWAKKPTVVGNANRGAGHRAVTQMVAIFENTGDAAEALKTVEHDWGLCPNGDIFFIELNPADNQRWVPYPVSTGPNRLGTTFQRDGLTRNCHHVVANQANVLVEDVVCTDGDSAAPANTLIDRILAKLPA